MEKGFYKYYTELPPWAKGVVIVGAGLVVYMVGSKLYRKIIPTQTTKDAKNELNVIDVEIKNNAKNGIKASYPDSQYVAWVRNIVDAISGCDYSAILIWSFGFQKVYDIFDKLKNDTDYLLLQKTFGIRTISKGVLCGGNYENVSFSQAMSKQFNNVEINLLNTRLKSKGISYRLNN
jgi:hypothetical protein